MKKVLIPIILLSAITGATLMSTAINKNEGNDVISPIAKASKENTFTKQLAKISSAPDIPKTPVYDTELASKDVINILLLGIDRRSKDELGYRTDIMILLSVNKKDNRVVLTSIP